MSTEKKYNEKEIAAIFKQAAEDFEVAQQNVSSGEGLTLSEIEEIAKEVGITPEFISRAAAKVDARHSPSGEKKLVGLPIEVKRVVTVPGGFGDSDWDRLVVDLHDTFGVIGSTKEDGRVRTWTSENMHVRLEPAGSDYRLRIEKTNSIAAISMVMGGIFVFMSLMFMAILMTKGRFMTQMDDTLIGFILAAIGLGAGGFSARRLPGWHKTESERMDDIIARTLGSDEQREHVDASMIHEEERIPIDDLGYDTDPVSARQKGRQKAK